MSTNETSFSLVSVRVSLEPAPFLGGFGVSFRLGKYLESESLKVSSSYPLPLNSLNFFGLIPKGFRSLANPAPVIGLPLFHSGQGLSSIPASASMRVAVDSRVACLS